VSAPLALCGVSVAALLGAKACREHALAAGAETLALLAPKLPRAMRAPAAGSTGIAGKMAQRACAASANGAAP
jgi:hypothetical protein